MGDGRYDQQKLLQAVEKNSKATLLLDLEAIAKHSGAMINAVMLGVIAGAGALPIPAEAFEAAIREDGKAVDTRKDVGLRVGQGTDVSFAAAAAASPEGATALSGITVTGNALPSIDVTSVDSRTVITSQQLAKLPLGRNAEAIARLAPGVVNNGGNFKSDTGHSLASFGGAQCS